MLISYHNHTNWSDGAPTLSAQIQAARAVGLDELGISDHYVLDPRNPDVEWSMDPSLLGDYVTQIRLAAVECPQPVIRLGVEADFFPETVEETRANLARHPFDFVIGSVHSVDGFPIDEDTSFWDALSEREVEDVWRLYWVRIRQMAESGAYDFVGHLDLPKKFGHRPAVIWTQEAEAALDAIARADMAVEINTAGWSLRAAEAYPSLPLLLEAHRRGIPLLINADAHFTEFLTRDFGRARELARSAGYESVVRYEQRRRHAYSLPQ